MRFYSRKEQLEMLSRVTSERGLSMRKLASETKIREDAFKDLKRGKSQSLSAENLTRLLQYMGVEQDEAAVKIPVCGDVPGGVPVEVNEMIPEEFVYYPIKRADVRNIGALRVIGDSMNNIAPDGAYIIVDFGRQDKEQLEGKPVIARIEGECTFKRFYRDPDILVPDSSNKSHKPIPLLQDWEILGLVVGVINRLEE